MGTHQNTWHLPKGRVEAHENLEQTALREIHEESGLTVTIKAYLGLYHNIFTRNDGTPVDKTNHYFLCKLARLTFDPHDSEHDRLDWYSAAEAIQKLTLHPTKKEGEIIKRAEAWFLEHESPSL